MTMGRRARTNCSPVDNALEKYHNDIGNRLSGVFVPPHPCPANSEESTCDAFSMLTLDFRGKHGVKHTTGHPTACQKSATMPQLNNTKDNNNSKNIIEESEESDCQKDDSAFGQISLTSDLRSSTLPSFNSQQNDFSAVSSLKEKRNIMDKLARAIFQRKHTCARCQRRSRSCLQNKTFNVSEKHYTCGRCRETSRAFKNLVTGQDVRSNNSNIDKDNMSKNNADIILRKPRLQLKDSGYETVTSCSTVASAHSSPYASSNRQNNENSHFCGNATETTTSEASPCLHGVTVTPSEVDNEVDELIRKANNGMTPPFLTGRRGETRGNPDSSTNITHGTAHLNSSDVTSNYVNTNNLNIAGIEQYLGVVGDDGCRVLKQVKTRYVQNYDGYLNLPIPVSCDRTHNNAEQHCDGYCNCNDSDVNVNQSDNEIITAITAQNKPAPKMCHICETTSRPCFRLPWEGGWLCEDCIDGML